jgi:hypothetical protein
LLKQYLIQYCIFGLFEFSVQKEEYSNIIREQMKSIMIMRYLRENGTDNSVIDPEVHCERGLESYQSKELRNEIDSKRKIHQFLVIREQARQALVGTKDPELLRLLSSTQSEGSLRTAQLRAALDQHEASQAGDKPLSGPVQEKKQPCLDDMNGSQIFLQQEPKSDSDSRADDPTGGIIPLASLWAQEESPFSSHEDTKHTEPGFHGMSETSSPGPSSSSYFQQGLLRNLPKATTNADGSTYVSPDSQRQGMPLVGFHGMYQTYFAIKPSAPVMSPQAIQNAFCSSFAHSSDSSDASTQQQHLLHQKFQWR